MNILIIAAHPDDEVLGMGATIKKLAKNKNKIHLAVITEGASAQYENKKMNLALTTVVAAMTSSLRYMFADQKFLNTENTTKEYNQMTNGLCDQMEGILTAALDIPNLISQAQSQSTSGALWADANSSTSVAGLLNLGGGGGSSSGTSAGGGGGGTGSSD